MRVSPGALLQARRILRVVHDLQRGQIVPAVLRPAAAVQGDGPLRGPPTSASCDSPELSGLPGNAYLSSAMHYNMST